MSLRVTISGFANSGKTCIAEIITAALESHGFSDVTLFDDNCVGIVEMSRHEVQVNQKERIQSLREKNPEIYVNTLNEIRYPYSYSKRNWTAFFYKERYSDEFNQHTEFKLEDYFSFKSVNMAIGIMQLADFIIDSITGRIIKCRFDTSPKTEKLKNIVPDICQDSNPNWRHDLLVKLSNNGKYIVPPYVEHNILDVRQNG
jgi:hypothetical protein